jgi:hypothetical protein
MSSQNILNQYRCSASSLARGTKYKLADTGRQEVVEGDS